MTSSTRPIRIGVQLQPQHAPRYNHIRDAVRRCEDLGVDVAFNWDHFFPLFGEPDGLHFESWTMLGAWAEQTERIEFGAAWKKTSKEQRDYVSFKLTLPGGTPVYLRLFENETTGDYELVSD